MRKRGLTYTEIVEAIAKSAYEVHEQEKEFTKKHPHYENEQLLKLMYSLLQTKKLYCPKCGKSEMEWSCCHTKLNESAPKAED